MDELDENINEKLRKVLGEMPGKLKIYDGSIDISIQMEYFEFSSKVKRDKKLTADKILLKSKDLFKNTLFPEQKKELLVLLSSVEKPEAYRVLEKFVGECDDELKNWAILAFQESTMLLEASILEETRVFLSSGLGGKDGKLRYQVVINVIEGFHLDDYRKKIIINEFTIELEKNKSVLEKTEFLGKYAIIEVLVPIDVNLRQLFRKAVKECNQFGNFVNTDFVVTNIKRLKIDEIEKIFNDKSNHGNAEK